MPVGNKTVSEYAKFYPEFTRASVRKALNKIRSEGSRLSAPTVNHYLIAKRFGGKGMGRKKRRN